MVLVEDELGLAPGIHNLLRRLRGLLSKMGVGSGSASRPLDPMVVDHEAWRMMRRNVRTWPDYREAPNGFQIGVSQPDWDEYWGIDTERKADSVARYLLKQASDKDLWIAGRPQVAFSVSDDVARGEVSIAVSFAESSVKAHRVEAGDMPELDAGIGPAGSFLGDGPAKKVSPDSTVVVPRRQYPRGGRVAAPTTWGQPAVSVVPEETIVLPRPTAPVADPQATQALTAPTALDAPSMASSDATELLPIEVPRAAYLMDDKGFRMLVHPGDVIGAVHEGESMSADVNIRLDGRGFPDVEPRHLSLAATADGWTVTDLATTGTVIETVAGERRTLETDETAALSEGDVIYLGPERPLRFQFGA